MAKKVSIFEQVAEQWEADEQSTFKGNPVSEYYRRISCSTDTKVIGRVFPQTEYINTVIAHEIKYHAFCWFPARFDRIELRKSAKLTDCISTAALPSNAFIISDRALKVFQGFDQGKHVIYPATVHHKGSISEYHVLHFINEMEGQLDCAKSRFHVTDMMGKPKFSIGIMDQGELEDKRKLVHEGAFPGTEKFDYVRLTFGYFGPSVRTPDIFTIMRAGTEPYISVGLADAIVEAGLTGFRINEALDLADPAE